MIHNKNSYTAIIRAAKLTDYNIHSDDTHTKHEFMKQTLLADNSLTENEKSEAIRFINLKSDDNNVVHNKGTNRICENCNQKCFATLYCEYCIRNYLKAKFSNWTSGNDDIDNLIQKCQLNTNDPDMIVEWIPYNNLKNIKYSTKGGFSEIYKADWVDGPHIEWDGQEQQLIRNGTQQVILKELENVESASQRWFKEVCNLKYL